ncbi:amino acid aminotransferase [Pararhizobium mangrovi]|uniref:Aspartate/tyrosine/aromatic aminotransferase n=1 Tax=Pararhizobium mangrovi TaxID=2590452 RepID=A0A506TZK6_9HYPH|nr:amino acid aminotransferase [Pararhizobium mangrovi]TPW26940.1 aspartate/tyrosine/aromatic aminotransferase [Pararhizobium mangrovi]
MFSSLGEASTDSILALMRAYREDPRAEKIDLGVGVYRDAAGTTPIMAAVKEAERHLVETQETKSYVGLSGDETFNAAMARLVLGDAVADERVSAVQTPGGSGALRLLSELAATAGDRPILWVSAPTWPNHMAVGARAGLVCRSYRYFDPETHMPDTDAMLADLSEARRGDVVLVHGCCHNPTGADLDAAQWDRLTALVVERGLVPLVDIAYLGFGEGLEADAAGLRRMAAGVPEMLVSVSCSKNFGLYRDRTGVALVISPPHQRGAVQATLETLVRTNWSMPPDHGAAVVRTILADEALVEMWHDELATMRERIVALRTGLAEAMATHTGSDHYSFLKQHRGMFSLLPASAAQVEALRKDHAIYVTGDGRANLAGLLEDRLDRIAEAFTTVGM